MSKQRKNNPNIMISYKEKLSREKAAALLESIALKLKEEGSFTLHQGDQSHKVEPAEILTVEVELEEKNGKYEFEIELEWEEGNKTQKLIID